MKIVLTGGGTGGHFYPLISVAESIEDLCKERALIEPELIYMGPAPFDQAALAEHDIAFQGSAAAPLRKNGGIFNALSFFPVAIGALQAILQLFRIYPDVVFSTGGFAAFPTLLAARVLRIPVVMFDPDAIPGRVSLWSAKFAKWIAVAHNDSAAHFPPAAKPKIAQVGYPIRQEIVSPAKEGGYEFLKLDPAIPTVFIMGGSQGARAINETALDALKDLVQSYNVVHQAGAANLDEVEKISSVILKDLPYANRYRDFGLLNTLALRMAAGVADLVIARAGSGTIFEVASWGIPMILVPIPEDVSHDQTENAFSYARAGACEVIEQENLSPHVLLSEIGRLIGDKELRARMSESAKAFSRPDAAKKIAAILLEESISHEPA